MKKIGLFQNIYLVFLLLPLGISAQDVELKNNFFYLDNQKFFVKGIGYEAGATPGSLPWAREFEPEILHSDIQRILSAGYNTIRTWAPFTEEELELLNQYDIKIIMGIWIDPHGDFSDPDFVNSAITIVSDVLSYSKNFDNIIAYLIMNEPFPETVAAAGYQATADLWTLLIQIIHNEHPGRPVSFSNTCNGTYIDPALFDFSGFNVYIYNPVTVSYLHGYREFVAYLDELSVPGKPLVITEYGLSVSPSGQGTWGYGGNTFADQISGVLHMYKSLVDGGAAGSCVFNYNDGWWKGGNEFVHDDNPEEWFGLVEYINLADKFGHERPIWEAVKSHQSAIITQPLSPEIYGTQVPIEVFFHDTINRLEIESDEDLLYETQVNSLYLLDTLFFSVEEATDLLLTFKAYDVSGNLVKSEEKSVLLSPGELSLPSIEVNITNEDYWETGFVNVQYQINKGTDFSTGSQLEYVYYPHIGFDYGLSFAWTMPDQQEVSFSTSHQIGANVDVFTVGGAIDASFGNFHKRIVEELNLSNLGEISPVPILPDPDLAFDIFPNPVSGYFSFKFRQPMENGSFSVFNSLGKTAIPWRPVHNKQNIDVAFLAPGIYYIHLRLPGFSGPLVKKIVKF